MDNTVIISSIIILLFLIITIIGLTLFIYAKKDSVITYGEYSECKDYEQTRSNKCKQGGKLGKKCSDLNFKALETISCNNPSFVSFKPEVTVNDEIIITCPYIIQRLLIFDEKYNILLQDDNFNSNKITLNSITNKNVINNLRTSGIFIDGKKIILHGSEYGMRMLYFSAFDNQQGLLDLKTFYDNGLNTLILNSSPWDAFKLEEFLLNYMKNDTLSKFNYILSIAGIIFDYKDDFYKNNKLNDTLKKHLDEFVRVGKKYPNIINGYYTFDEPLLSNINKEYQEEIFNYIRNLDNNSLKRPVIIADTLWSKNINDIKKCKSTTTQDVLFIDQYTNNYQQQVDYFNLWRDSGVLTSWIPILTAYKSENDCKNAIDIQENYNVYKKVCNNLSIYMHEHSAGYFSYTITKNLSDFAIDIFNCDKIKDMFLLSLNNI